MAYSFAIPAVGIHKMLEHWYQYFMLVVLALSSGGAIGYLLWLGSREIRRVIRKRRAVVSKVDVKTRLFVQQLSESVRVFRDQGKVVGKPHSFGVYYGTISALPSEEELRILRQCEMLVVDPRQPGVSTALASMEDPPKFVVGRIDVKTVTSSFQKSDNIGKLKGIADEAVKLMGPRGGATPYNGILLANWDGAISDQLFAELLRFLDGLNLNVYLEVCAPKFIDSSCFPITHLAGMLFVNGSIMPNGERRDYPRFLPMKTALDLAASQTFNRDFSLLMCEIIDDGASVTNAVLRRSFNWCGYFGAILWIGPRDALTNASKNVPVQSPDSAFAWLKNDKVVEIHDNWRLNYKISPEPVDDIENYSKLECYVPNITQALDLKLIDYTSDAEEFLGVEHFNWVSKLVYRTADPLSTSSHGVDYSGLGCFPIGMHAEPHDFETVLRSQTRLLGLSLLQKAEKGQLMPIAKQIERLLDDPFSWSANPNDHRVVRRLVSGLKAEVQEDMPEPIEVYIGLDSGFRSCDSKLWGVYDGDDETTRLFIARDAKDFAGTILHTFMSSQNCSRGKCFETEQALARSCGEVDDTVLLPARIAQDLEMLSPEESLILLQNLAISGTTNELYGTIREFIEHELIDVTSSLQLRKASAMAYLTGEVSAEDLISQRFQWYRQLKISQLPRGETAVTLFKAIDRTIEVALKYNLRDQLEAFFRLLEQVITTDPIDVRADILALSVFCAFRKHACDEIYLEITDRNPYMNDQPDQAAIFAELFALGSHCESYFDLTAKAIGRVLYAKYRAFYRLYPPQIDSQATKTQATMYGSANPDEDAEGITEPHKGIWFKLRNTSYIGVYSFPALIDILLLTTTGRGLYLSAYMGDVPQRVATFALLISLVISGAVSAWICCGGSYYLWARVYSTMNAFMLTRLIGGIVLASIVGLLSVIGFGVGYGLKNGALTGLLAAGLFFLYIMVLTFYLYMLAMLSNLQFPGSPLPSGRTAIGLVLTILVVPLILSKIINHDAILYIVFLVVFAVCLFIRAAQVLAKWNTWLLNLSIVADQDVLEWYRAKSNETEKRRFEALSAPAAMQVARTALFNAVSKERKKSRWSKPTTDGLVRRLAQAYTTSVFILDWYSSCTGIPKPLPYSSTWNGQIKVALQSLRASDKGLRLHNGFVHWRYAKAEIAYGFMYFIIALLDRWIELFCGGNLIGIAVLDDGSARVSMGFSLMYYLSAAYILDLHAADLYANVNVSSTSRITSPLHLDDILRKDVRRRNRLYWSKFGSVFAFHLWGLALCVSIVWAYVENEQAVFLFFAYGLAYFGLLWFQYNKVFALDAAIKPLLFGILIGFLIGIPLRKLRPDAWYNDVLALGIATWTAALLTFGSLDLSPARFQEYSDITLPTYSQKSIGPVDRRLNQRLSDLFDELEKLPKPEVLEIKMPGPVAEGVLQKLSRGKASPKSDEVKAAFPRSFDLLNQIIVSWDSGATRVYGVSLERMVGPKHDVCAISRKVGAGLKIFVGMQLKGKDWMSNFESNTNAIAEAIVHEYCEVFLGWAHGDAVLAELLVHSDEELRLPHRIQRQLELSSPQELHRIRNRRDEEMVHQLGLHVNFDREWDTISREVRDLLVKRICGEAYEINAAQIEWIKSKRAKDINYATYLARRNLNACLTLLVDDSVENLLRNPAQKSVAPRREPSRNSMDEFRQEVTPDVGRFLYIHRPLRRIYRIVLNTIKFVVMAMIAEPEFQRELAYLLSRNPLKTPVIVVLSWLWLYARFVQDKIYPLFLLHGRPHVQKLAKLMKSGVVTTIRSGRIVIDDLKSPRTAFVDVLKDGTIKLWQYSGHHAKKPEGDVHLVSINLYSKSLALLRRQEFLKGEMINDFVYEYNERAGTKLRKPVRLPISRSCLVGEREGEIVQYSRKGFIKSGKSVRNNIPFTFEYEYRRKAKFDDELLRIKYVFNPGEDWALSAHVWWCVPPVRRSEETDRWIPFNKVTQAQFTDRFGVYDTKWVYDHKCHPILSTTHNGIEVETPDMILHDHMSVFTKPKSTSFVNEDPLLPFDSLNSGFLARLFGRNRKIIPVSTSRSRNFLWKTWKDSTLIDGITARWLDELSLRSDPTLKPYWYARDRCDFRTAIKYLRANGEAIMASVDMDHEVSAWTSLAFKMSDFFSMGQGGDTSINTRTTNSQIDDGHHRLHVLATDTGTWPNEGGGVSCCRRDMVNNLNYIKWHMVSETANDYGIPKFQTEQNIQSLKILPLWGLDFLTPTHGVFENQLDTKIDEKLVDTSNADIRAKFIPILVSLVHGARSIEFTPESIEEFTNAFIRLNAYFETREWGAVWKSTIVKGVWRELWLSTSMGNTRPFMEWLDVEKPAFFDLDAALEMYSRFLFIFSLPVPDRIPTVFQATHHAISAVYGVVCKKKRLCTVQIWDHAISWRETNMFMSSSQCNLAPFVRISLIGLMRLAAHINLYHADVILPCTSYFNPGWEIDLGTCEGSLQHRKKFARKVDPVVNGICDMDTFKPVEKITTDIPTVTMLSHVQFTKDVKTAILAADVIVNKWGFKDYRLEVYGNLDRTPAYTGECQELIASKALREYVSLKGYGQPEKVFQRTWVFLNSSLSEGLPLAIGEAALTGAPIVCTDVGATFQIVSDPDDPKKRFGAVVAPNDPYALARAQISMLAVMDEWTEYAEDTEPFPPMPDKPTPEDVERITKRIYEKREQRRIVGSQLRGIVQRSFSGERYLREHEQMLWVGKYMNEAKREQIVREKRLTTIDVMLDDVYPDRPWHEYRPDFLRSIAGFSAFESVTGFNRSTGSTLSRTVSMSSEQFSRRLNMKHPQSPMRSRMSFDNYDDEDGSSVQRELLSEADMSEK